MPPSAFSPNAPSATHLENAVQVTRQIRNRVRAVGLPQPQTVPYLWHEYEGDINRLLDAFLPQCVLSGVKLFTPSFLDSLDYGLEVDNLLHISHENTDYLVLIEAKNQRVQPSGNEWQVRYEDGNKDAKQQLKKHIGALLEYLEPISKDVSLKFLCYVVAPEAPVPAVKAVGHNNAELYLVRFDELIPHLAGRLGLNPAKKGDRGSPMRIAQSRFLDLLRLSFANSHLGHPEISSAVRYVDRCRRELDQSLFRLFDPSPERWLINGSAGMGKSVLLAYTAAVLSSGYHMQKSIGAIGIYRATVTLEKIGFEPMGGTLAMVAMSQKQLDSLRYWFDYFVKEFQRLGRGLGLQFQRPDFFLFRDMGHLLTSKHPWSAVFVDEAHDLPDHAARTLKEASDQLGFYLVAACDRHQRLKLAGADAKVINGFNFTNKSKRLRQVYRNPAPIYIASLALMFRWFGSSGPKIVPSEKELKDCFGFKVAKLAGQPARLSIKNDAHPANAWRHTVARFGDAASAAALLRREKLARSEVLWVRFSAEDPSFDYEALQQDFTYHNCRTEEAADLNDKYIKGQDYPVVVIEGFPRFMDQFDSSANEDEMWAFRRELYLCASRATCFLFFICNVTASEEIDRIDQELDALLTQVSVPWENNGSGNGTREWSFLLKETETSRSMAEFADAVQAGGDATDLASQEPQAIMATLEEPQVPLAPAVEAADRPDLVEAPPLAPGTEEPEPDEPEIEHMDEPEPAAGGGTAPVPSIAIANAYGSWPIDADLVPPYEWVLLVNESESVRDYAERLGCTVPDLLGKLRNRGLNYATNTPIPIPVMRSLAFEFECYPASSQMEYDSISAEAEEDDEVAADTPVAKLDLKPEGVAAGDAQFADSPKPVAFVPKPAAPNEGVARDVLDLISTDRPSGDWKPQALAGLDDASISKLRKIEEAFKTRFSGSKEKGEESTAEDGKIIRIKPPIIVSDLAALMGVKPFIVLADLIKLQVFVSPNQAIEPDIAEKVCEIHGFVFLREKRVRRNPPMIEP